MIFTETAENRRATALGILATPARALALIQKSLAQPMVPGLDDSHAFTFPERDEGPLRTLRHTQGSDDYLE